MKILLIGASGTIGSAVFSALERQHEIITASRSESANVQVNLDNHNSIRNMFEQVGYVDAIICTAGNGQLLPLHQHSDEDYHAVLHNKLMGQVNLVRYGLKNLSQGGSITLTSGRAHRDSIPSTTSIAIATAGLEGFINAAKTELTDVRLNAVSPSVVKESIALLGLELPNAISATDTAKAYVEALEGSAHGSVLQSSDFAS